MKILFFTAILWLFSDVSSAQNHLSDSVVKAFQSKTTWSEETEITISIKKLHTVIRQKDKKNNASTKCVIRARRGITKVYYDDQKNHIDAIYLNGKLYRIYWTEWEHNGDGASNIIKSTTWVSGNILSIKNHRTGKHQVINLLEYK